MKRINKHINWHLFILLFLVYVVYFGSLNHEFVSDDIVGIVENSGLEDIGYFLTNIHTIGRNIPLAIILKLFGPEAFYFRLYNILLHTGVVICIYVLVRRLHSDRIAFFATGLFAVHPLLTESVTWISGGGYVQYSLFFLLSFLAYINNFNRKQRIFSLLFFVFALASHRSATVLPFLFFAYEYWQKKKGIFAVRRVLPYISLSFFYSLMLIPDFRERMSVYNAFTFSENSAFYPFLYLPIAIFNYIRLIFLPLELSFYHTEFNYSPAVITGIFFITTFLFLLIIFSFKRNRTHFFWLIWFIIPLLPVLTPFGISWLVAERYVYLSVIGFAVLTGLAMNSLSTINRQWPFFLTFILMILLSARTVIRNNDWKNPETLWLATSKSAPSSPWNHNNLGDVYVAKGQHKRAIIEFQTAIRLNPLYAEAHHNLAQAYLHQSEKDKAVKHFLKAIQIKPLLWQSHMNVSSIYFAEQRYDEALKHTQKALEIDPKNSQLYTNLGIIYLAIHHQKKAEKALMKALKFDPINSKARSILEKLK